MTPDRSGGWRSPLAILTGGYLAATALTGLSIWLLPFSVPNQIVVLVHTGIGILFLVPCLWYSVKHLQEYWRKPLSHIVVLGYLGTAALLVCLVSGVVVTWQAVLGTRIGYAWDIAHIISTIGILGMAVPHVVVIVLRDWKSHQAAPAAYYGKRTAALALGALLLVAVGYLAYRPPHFQSEFPKDYSWLYGPDRPFAPSLARTSDGRPIDSRLLAGSLNCGTSGCHEQIVEEWQSSAHRYSAMDLGFQKIQINMAKLNGPESTRYCGGCHDPMSLFSGTKNLFTDTEKLTSIRGYQEGVSCLVCHGVRKVDVKGNANYVLVAPQRYMFEVEYDENPTAAKRLVRDFLIRAYPWQHSEELGKRLFKTPEYCAACHKQFIDQEINNLGWVQLQNQYDNWRESRWNHPGDPKKTIECRECHMPLVQSTDPAAGDEADYNRSANDGKHRTHRFVAGNQMMPALLKVKGWQKQVQLTKEWLQGKYEVPEIADKWRGGPVVGLELDAPQIVGLGDKVDLRLILTSNKVGHDFPTGPLDIIQAWLQVEVTDQAGKVVFERGAVDAKGFIQPGTFMFKAEPVDKNGNLIDRHNLWEMVGVRYRRSLFPGYSDVAEMSFFCPMLAPVKTKKFPQSVSYGVGVPSGSAGKLTVKARLCYRKIDQYLVNFLFGEQAGLTAPVTVMAEQTATIVVEPRSAAKTSD